MSENLGTLRYWPLSNKSMGPRVLQRLSRFYGSLSYQIKNSCQTTNMIFMDYFESRTVKPVQKTTSFKKLTVSIVESWILSRVYYYEKVLLEIYIPMIVFLFQLFQFTVKVSIFLTVSRKWKIRFLVSFSDEKHDIHYYTVRNSWGPH